MKKESAVLKEKIYAMSNLTRAQREAEGKKAFTNLLNYFNILIVDKKISAEYVRAFASLFIRTDKKIEEKELEFFEKVLKIKLTEEEFVNYINELDKKRYVMKSIEYISHSGEHLIDDALTLGLSICYADGIMSKEEADYFQAVSTKLSLVKY